jgi:hypothetical protein
VEPASRDEHPNSISGRKLTNSIPNITSLVMKNVCKFNLSKCSWFDRLREINVWAALSPDEQTK